VADVAIRPMLPGDASSIVAVHLKAFQGFFLTILGPRFLRLLYTHIAASPQGVAYSALNDRNEVIGFVCGSTQPSGFYTGFVRTRWPRVVLAVLGSVLRRPAIAPRLVWRVLHPPQASTGLGIATLMSIAVLPEYQNRGIGRTLTREFLGEMRRRGTRRVNLTTDKEGNDDVNAFYQRMGFHVARSFVTREGRWMNEYAIDLS
jgi:ribosomal protein S18 acetylase RimI-like enzyme